MFHRGGGGGGGGIKINGGKVQHFSENILNSNQFMSTTHTLFYMSTSYLESENEVLKYVLRVPLPEANSRHYLRII